MITSKKTDGTYGEIGFIKAKQDDGSYKDIEYQYDNKGNLIFEKGFMRSKEGVLPLVINGIDKPLKDYTIYGNIYQAEGVSSDTPQEVKAVGDKTGNLYSWSGNLLGSSGLTVSENKSVISSVIDVRGIDTIYFTGDNTLLNSKVYRISKSDTPIEVGSTIKTFDSSFTGGVYDVSDCNYLLVTASVYAMPQENIELIKNTFMLNSGSTPLPYEPYGYKVDVECRGKNLFSFPETKETGSSAVVKHIKGESKFYVAKASSSTVERALPIDIRLVAGTYTVSVKGLLSEGGRNEQIYFKTLDGRSLAIGTKPNAPMTFTLAEETDISVLQCVFQTVHENTEVSVQLEAGTEATSYEPFWLSPKNARVIGIQPTTNYAYFDKKSFGKVAVGDTVQITAGSTSKSLKVNKIDDNYVYVENTEV